MYYMRQRPFKTIPFTSGTRRHRKWKCTGQWTSKRGIFVVFLLSLLVFSLVCWISLGRFIEDRPSWMTWPQVQSQPNGVAPIPDDEFHPYNRLEVSDVVDLNHIRRLNSTRTAFYVLCAGQESIDYVQYLSLASVIRFFAPSRLVLLVESDPVRLDGGRWSSDQTLKDLLGPCPAYRGSVLMKGGSLVCRDPEKMHEFIVKLLLQFGGLYVGRRTFLTELASFMRPTFIEEHILSHLTDDAEGFAYIRQPISSYENMSFPRESSSSSTDVVPVPIHPAGQPRSSDETPVKVRYLTSRQLNCLDSTRLTDEVLHRNDGTVKYPCLFIRDPVSLDPWSVVRMKTEFGDFARKAVYNIYNSEEAMYFLRATNTPIIPPLCNFRF